MAIGITHYDTCKQKLVKVLLQDGTAIPQIVGSNDGTDKQKV